MSSDREVFRRQGVWQWIKGHAGLLAFGIAVLLGFGGLISCVTIEKVAMAPPNIPGAEYVGTQTCLECHEKIVRDFDTATHAQLVHHQRDGLALGCESCHGPGSLHSESGGAYHTIINPDRNPETCFQCHLQVRAQFNLPHRHPLEPGKVTCSDCHELHKGPAMASGWTAMASANDTCLQCHTAQHGPHVFEHEAVREGCVTCHSPHGSVNPKMLTERNSNLCLKCHPTMRTPSGVFIGGYPHMSIGLGGGPNLLSRGTCWSAGCHEAVHGSQVSSSLRF